MKPHARDYLNEFAVTAPIWLKELIYHTVSTNGRIEPSTLDDIYPMLISTLDVSIVHDEPTYSDSGDKIQLEFLHHISGVNALKEEQKIKFGENCTVLFGLNGSGKSSYFKILNEVTGGNELKPIMSNIHSASPKDIKVGIDYKINNRNEHIEWNNTSRSIAPLDCIRVFDSSYLEGLLSKRELDSTLLQPFGLHLFSYVISMIDSLKQRLQEEAKTKREIKPAINLEHLSQERKTIFQTHTMSTEQTTKIEEYFGFSVEKKEELDSLKNQIKNLNQNNIQDKIKLIQSNIRVLLSFRDELIANVNHINSLIVPIRQAIEKHQVYSKKSSESKELITVLKDIPYNDTDEWKKFIEMGRYYSEKIEDSAVTCVYCRQPLKENALQVVQAYAQFLENDSEVNLEHSKGVLSSYGKALEEINFLVKIDYESKKIIQSYNLNNGLSLCKATISTLREFKSLKASLKVVLEQIEIGQELNMIEFSSCIDVYNTLITSLQTQMSDLTKNENEKSALIEHLQQKIKILLENQAIYDQKRIIEEWMLLQNSEVGLLRIRDNISTNALSSLSKTAHNNLLTEGLKTKFTEELNKLGLNGFRIELSDAGVSKGKSTTKLLLMNRDDITSILSEGEQKAIGLSMFIAEARMQVESNPIIFDDPVNSLDHKIASSFANRILELENQIVVFTHNKLFLDAFETSKLAHICKNFDGGCSKEGKHIYLYSIEAEGRSSKGVVIQRKEDRAKTYLLDAKTYLSETPFEKHLETSSKLRKTVECLVDEEVFKSMVPTKCTSKNNRIHWDSLKKLNTDSEFIDILRGVHDRVSGGSMHNGTEAEEDPIDKQEYDDMVCQLEAIMQK